MGYWVGWGCGVDALALLVKCSCGKLATARLILGKYGLCREHKTILSGLRYTFWYDSSKPSRPSLWNSGHSHASDAAITESFMDYEVQYIPFTCR